MKKTIFLYGFILAVLIAALKAVEYRYTIRKIDVDIYMGLIAILFTGLGIWVGLQVLQRRAQSHSVTNAGPPQSNLPDKEKMKELDLSEREMEVLALMSDGLSNQEIADQLFISIHTVKTHSSNLFSKLHVKRRTQAVQKSKEIGLIP